MFSHDAYMPDRTKRSTWSTRSPVGVIRETCYAHGVASVRGGGGVLVTKLRDSMFFLGAYASDCTKRST